MSRFVSYLRVSTDGQGRSGLGLEAQRQAVAQFLIREAGELVAEHVEVESGRKANRPALDRALAHCRMTGAVLLVGKLDRLARDTRFLLAIVDNAGENGVRFCDLPQIPAGAIGRFMLTQMAAVAELEAGLISERTKAALAAAKAKGKKLGNPNGWGGKIYREGGKGAKKAADAFAASVGPLVMDLRQKGLSLRQIAAQLAFQGVRTARGGSWTAASVRNVIERAATK